MRNILIILTTVSLLFPSISKGQDSSKRAFNINRLTLGYGIGFDSYPDNRNLNFAISIDYSIQKNKNLFTLGCHSSNEMNFILGPRPNNRVNSYEITYGRTHTKGDYFFALSGGMSYNHRIERGKYLYSESILGPDHYEKIGVSTLGVPISIRSVWNVFRKYGVGLELYANINKTSYYCITLISQFGNLRD